MCRKAIGMPQRPFTRSGEPLHQFAANSAFAERTVVKAVQAVRIPKDIPLTSAALIGCGVLTGVGAVLNRARVDRGDTVLVIGTGGIGLNVIQGARLAGALRIVAVDSNPAKEDVARRFGATHFLTSVDGVKDILPTGAQHAFECVGRVELIRQAVDALDRHGQAILLGVPRRRPRPPSSSPRCTSTSPSWAAATARPAPSGTSPCTPSCTAKAVCCSTSW